jgi:hypothetical protein
MIKKLNFHTNFILYGKYGCGKTTCACSAPKPIALIDADNKANNQVNIKPLVESGDVDIFPLNYPLIGGGDLDYILKPDTANEIPEGYKAFVNLVNRIIKVETKEYATIVIDSGSRVIQHLIQLTTAVNNKAQMTPALWGIFYSELANRFTRILSIPINFIWIFHENVYIDETTKHQIISPSIPGQMGQDVGSYFNEVYSTKVEAIGDKYYYYLITKSCMKYNNRTSGNLELKEEPDIARIISKLDGTYIAPPIQPKPLVNNSNVVRHAANIVRKNS